MDPLPTPLPATVKANCSKPKLNPKVNQPARMGTAEPQIHCRQNRVFGTGRSTNIPAKPVSDNKSITKTKLAVAVPHRQQPKPKPIRPTQLPLNTSTQTETTDTKFPENVNPKMNEKNDTFLQRLVEKPDSKNSQEKDSSSAEPKTPVASSHVRTTKSSKAAATPFYTAMHCSKCRFDRLETSSYWVGQIKMAESVGKHFVASDFFRLALETQAEPIRNLRIELRRYLLRHGYLSDQKEWREVAARYGLLKVESNTRGIDSDSSTNSSSICRKNESDMG